MKRYFLYIFCIISLSIYGQQEFHVFPKDNTQTPGSEFGDGSISRPWDLQTALSQKSDVVKSGDTIWLHEGVYNGRYKSSLQSEEPNKYITVSGYKDDKVILNGNVPIEQTSVLLVRSKQVIFKNFEVTWIGDFSRNYRDPDFDMCFGIEHASGNNCRFYNIIIHDNPGLGMGSWKSTAGTIIENCIIYNNGFFLKNGKGAGEGIYVQNKSEETRIIKNNIIFNNYYKGIEVWSAGKRADFEFVKNITLDGNVIFNSGSASGVIRDNVIVASHDYNGINIAHDIILNNNVLYHNTHNENGKWIGDAPSLTFGFVVESPVENITATNNVIFGGTNALRMSIAKSINFSNNIIYGAVQVGPKTSDYIEDWNFKSNTYYAKNNILFRMSRGKNHTLDTWQETYGLDIESKYVHHDEVAIAEVLHMSKHSQVENKYTIALFNPEGDDVEVDFSDENMSIGQAYTIYDVENLDQVLTSGTVSEDFKIRFPMQSTAFKMALNNTKAIKTLSNFGVFIIEFETSNNEAVEVEEKESALRRFFKWLGF